MSDNQFSTERKKKLASRISELRNKDDLKKIKKIIFELNPEIAVNRDSGGMLMFFQNLTNDTYVILENFLKEIEMRKITKHTMMISKSSKKLHSESDTLPNVLTSDSYKYSNKEKSIIRKKEYEKRIKQSVSEQVEATPKTKVKQTATQDKKKIIISNTASEKTKKTNNLTIFAKKD